MTLLQSKQTLHLGDSAPHFKLLGIDNKQHTLEELKGEKATLIIFMCNHCPFVIPKFDMMRELYYEFKEDGVEIIGINPNDHPSYPEDNLESMKEIHAQKKLGFAYVIDSSQEIARSFDAVCTPDPFLFDKDLTLIWHGRLNDAMFPDDTVREETMKEVIVEYLKTEKVTKKFKPSQGCSIKWR